MTQLSLQNYEQALGQRTTNAYIQLPCNHCPLRLNTISESSPNLRTWNCCPIYNVKLRNIPCHHP